MNPFEILKEDHRAIKSLFGRLEPTTERALKTREELFGKLRSELDAHARLEETILYPALKEVEKTRDLTLEGIEEHRLVKQLLGELAMLPKDTEQWTAKYTVLQESVEHHLEEEEGELFKQARSALSKEELEELGTRLEAEKKKQMAAGQR